ASTLSTLTGPDPDPRHLEWLAVACQNKCRGTFGASCVGNNESRQSRARNGTARERADASRFNPRHHGSAIAPGHANGTRLYHHQHDTFRRPLGNSAPPESHLRLEVTGDA